jgi:hypothetical protein
VPLGKDESPKKTRSGTVGQLHFGGSEKAKKQQKMGTWSHSQRSKSQGLFQGRGSEGSFTEQAKLGHELIRKRCTRVWWVRGSKKAVQVGGVEVLETTFSTVLVLPVVSPFPSLVSSLNWKLLETWDVHSYLPWELSFSECLPPEALVGDW